MFLFITTIVTFSDLTFKGDGMRTVAFIIQNGVKSVVQKSKAKNHKWVLTANNFKETGKTKIQQTIESVLAIDMVIYNVKAKRKRTSGTKWYWVIKFGHYGVRSDSSLSNYKSRDKSQRSL